MNFILDNHYLYVSVSSALSPVKLMLIYFLLSPKYERNVWKYNIHFNTVKPQFSRYSRHYATIANSVRNLVQDVLCSFEINTSISNKSAIISGRQQICLLDACRKVFVFYFRR